MNDRISIEDFVFLILKQKKEMSVYELAKYLTYEQVVAFGVRPDVRRSVRKLINGEFEPWVELKSEDMKPLEM